MPIKISIIDDFRSIFSGTKKLSEAFDDVADSLDDLATDAQATATDVGRQTDRMEDSAGDAAHSLEVKFADALKQVSKDARDTGDNVGDSMRRGAKEATEGTEALKDNAGSNLKEVAASFDGSMESLTDGLQGFLAEATEGFGPAGLLAGAVIGGGLGILQSRLQASADKANEVTEAAADMAREFSGLDADDRVQALNEKLNDLLYSIRDNKSWFDFWQKTAVTAVDQVSQSMNDGSASVDQFLAAFTEPDSTQRLGRLNAALATSSDRIRDLTLESNRRFAETRQFDQSLQSQIDHEQALQAIIREQVDTASQQVRIEEAVARAKGQSAEASAKEQAATEAATEATDKARAAAEEWHSTLAGIADPVSTYEGLLDEKNAAEQAAAEATAAATDDTSDSWEDYVKTASVSVDDLIAEWQRQATEAQNFEKNLATIAAAGGQELADELRAKGPAVAGAVADVIANAGPEKQRAAIAAHAVATGQELVAGAARGVASDSGVLARALQDAVNGAANGLAVPRVTFQAQLDTGQLNADIARLARTPGTIEFRARIGQKGII